jgi:DNA-binding transcriptional regulator YiaG
MELKGFIKARRESVGLSQDALGAKLGISPRTVSNWETGGSKPTMGPLAMLRLCKALQITLEDLALYDHP